MCGVFIQLIQDLEEEHRSDVYISEKHLGVLSDDTAGTENTQQDTSSPSLSSSTQSDPPHKRQRLHSPTCHVPSSGLANSHTTGDAHHGASISRQMPVYDPSKMTFDPSCTYCGIRFRDPEPHELIMYLHAHKYKVSSSVYDINFAILNKYYAHKSQLIYMYL